MALLILSLLVSACETRAPTMSDAPPAPTETPVRGGRVIFPAVSDISTLQPILSTDDASSGVWSLIYAPLLDTDPQNGEPRPALAERFEISSDGTRLTYTLRKDLVWSDGTPLTGEDFRYMVHAVARSKKSPAASTFEQIVGWADYANGRETSLRGVRVLDGGRTIEITLQRASCTALRAMARAPLPRHHFVRHWEDNTRDVTASIDNNPFNRQPPAASGPFVFKEHRPGDQITLTRNDRYYLGSPLLDEVVFKIFANAAAIRVALQAGEVTTAAVTPGDVDVVRKTPGLSEYRTTQLGYSFIGWNQKAARAPWLADKRVRKALWYGLDVDTIVDKILLGFGSRVWANTPPQSWAYDATGLQRYDYDLQRARTLLESAGATLGPDGIYRWTDGSPMRMRIETNSGNPIRETLVQIAQQQYKAIGIAIEPVLQSFPKLVERLTTGLDGSLEGVIIGFSFTADPDDWNIWHSSSQGTKGLNFVGFANAQADAALERNRHGPDCSRAARKAAIHELDTILNEEVPYTLPIRRTDRDICDAEARRAAAANIRRSG